MSLVFFFLSLPCSTFGDHFYIFMRALSVLIQFTAKPSRAEPAALPILVFSIVMAAPCLSDCLFVRLSVQFSLNLCYYYYMSSWSCSRSPIFPTRMVGGIYHCYHSFCLTAAAAAAAATPGGRSSSLPHTFYLAS